MANDGQTSLTDLYNTLLDRTGYLISLSASGESDAQDRIDNVKELASFLARYESENEEGDLTGFLEEVSLLTDVDNYDSHSDSVVMMTIHSAKGLEFPVVFLPGMEEGIFPSMHVIYNPSQIEEERRLAYVAITRAKSEIYMLSAESRMFFGSSQHNEPSRFLGEIPKKLMEVTKTRTSLPRIRIANPPVPRKVPARSGTAGENFQKFSASPSKIKYKAGDTVLHKIFGSGTVLSANKIGNDTLLEVRFETKGKVKLMANYAPLQKK